MDKDTLLNPRWTLLMAMDDITNWDYDDYKLLYSTPIFVSDEYAIAEVELKDLTLEPTVENVFNDIPCLAIHEEWTNAVITTDECIPLLQEQYSWSGSGASLLTSMLTHNERIVVLDEFLRKKEIMLAYDKVMLSFDKNDTKVIPLKGNEIKIIDEGLSAIKWDDHREVAWWPGFLDEIDTMQLYLAIVNTEDDNYPDLDDEGIFYNDLDDVDPYADYGKEYNWVDQYCNERGYL